MQADLFEADCVKRDAYFVGSYRIRLSRDWATGRRAMVIGCNPSNADALKDDPTSRWWNHWFKRAGFGGYDAFNLYPFCTSSPKACREIAANLTAEDHAALFELNLPSLIEAARSADQIFVCWGAIAWDNDWIAKVSRDVVTVAQHDNALWCWGTTMDGSPKHPLARGRHRISAEQPAEVWVLGGC